MLELIKNQKSNPFAQVIAILVIMCFFMLVTKITGVNDSEVNPTGPWEIMAAFVLFYALVNCVFSLQAPELSVYFRNSVFGFMALLLIGGGLSYMFSGTSINDAGSIRWILMVFSVGYLVFLSIVNLMRFIVGMAQKQDKRLRGEE